MVTVLYLFSKLIDIRKTRESLTISSSFSTKKCFTKLRIEISASHPGKLKKLLSAGARHRYSSLLPQLLISTSHQISPHLEHPSPANSHLNTWTFPVEWPVPEAGLCYDLPWGKDSCSLVFPQLQPPVLGIRFKVQSSDYLKTATGSRFQRSCLFCLRNTVCQKLAESMIKLLKV